MFPTISTLLSPIRTNSISCITKTLKTGNLILRSTVKNMSGRREDSERYAALSRQVAPALTDNKHKGQAGRVGVFGGCLEYTGAPYFAAISSLKVGADLVHVFCMKDAATVIKSYSPELIVHPYLDDKEAAKKIEPWLDRLHVVVIGPGLGREPETFQVIKQVFELCRARKLPLVVDADGLFYLSQNPESIKDYPQPGVILTPNKMEFARLFGLENPKETAQEMIKAAKINYFDHSATLTILCKGREDEIIDREKFVNVSGGGSGRRCGGQGDLLSGSIATFYSWALQQPLEPNAEDNRAMVAIYAACRLIRNCNARAFEKRGRSMLASDMIEEIHPVFEELYEVKR